MSYSGPGTGGGGSKEDKGKGGSATGGNSAGGSKLGGKLAAAQKKTFDLGALSNIGQGESTAAHVETGKFNNGKRTESGAGPKSAPEPQKNLPTGVTPLTEPKPMGATPYVEGADWLGKGARILGGIGSAAVSALGQALTGEDPTESMLGEHLGKQVGWSADPSMTPGRDRGQRGSKRESFDQTTLGSATSTARDDGGAKPTPQDSENFSDIQLADRRKPGLKQMLETML